MPACVCACVCMCVCARAGTKYCMLAESTKEPKKKDLELKTWEHNMGNDHDFIKIAKYSIATVLQKFQLQTGRHTLLQ